MDGEHFGTTADGEVVQRFTIAGGGLTAKIMNWGAAVQDLRLAGHDAPLVLGFEHFADYPAIRPIWARSPAATPTASPAAVSPSPAEHYQADTNFLGKHTLHGGAKGFGKRVWDVALHGDDFVTLTLAFARRRHGISRRDRRHLHLPPENSRHAVDRAHRDDRRADAVQPCPPFLFQPRRWRQRRHSRPPADAGGARPTCRSTTN